MKAIIRIIALLVITGGTAFAQELSSYQISPTGSFTLSGGSYTDAGEGSASGLKVNDIRLGIRSDLGDRWTSELIMGFTDAKVSFKEMYLRYTFPNRLSNVQLGHFPEPFGLEFIESPPFNRFSSSSSPTQAFSAKRKIGIQYTRRNDFLWGAAGIFADGNVMSGAINGPQGYAFTGRLVANPRRGDGCIIHTGVAATWRRADGNGISDRSVSFSSNGESPFDGASYAAITIPQAYAQEKVALEGIFSSGRFSLMGEGYLAKVSRTGDLVPYNAGGCYAQAGFLLSGDRSYSYEGSKARLGMCSAGTWEIMIRYSYLDLNDDGSSLYGGMLEGMTLNANWYATPFIRLRFGIGRIATDSYCTAGEGSVTNFHAQIMIMLN